jgi:adenylosuccinate synthase
MTCTIVVGGQFGSEGKGKVVALLASEHRKTWVVRCGGPNSGHSVSIGNDTYVFRQLPAAAPNPDATLLLSAGCAVDPAILVKELVDLGINRSRVIVDPRAVLIEESDRLYEASLRTTIASTASGTGAAVSRRLLRGAGVRCAHQSPVISQFARVEPVAPLIHGALSSGGHVIVEGTQGFGLSLLHGPFFPHVTSRDTTASAFASESGIAPHHVTDVILVLRTFPIRVGGPSGPLPNEITWEEVQRLSGDSDPFPEFTSVTKTLRRVALFDLQIVQAACDYNRPTALALMGADRLDASNRGVRDLARLSVKALGFLHWLERSTRINARFVGTGFGTNDMISVRRRIEDERLSSRSLAIT